MKSAVCVSWFLQGHTNGVFNCFPVTVHLCFLSSSRGVISTRIPTVKAQAPNSKLKFLTISSTKLQGVTCILRALFGGRFDMQDCNISVQVLDAAMLTSDCKDIGNRFCLIAFICIISVITRSRMCVRTAPLSLAPDATVHEIFGEGSLRATEVDACGWSAGDPHVRICFSIWSVG